MQNIHNYSLKFTANIQLVFFYILFGAVAGLFFSGCGYVIEGNNPVLPKEAKTLAILPIQNQTYKAGLETDLAEQLKLLLRSNSSVKLTSSGQADLSLSINLLKLETSVSGLSKDLISTGVKAKILASAVLNDRRTGEKVWQENTLEVKLTESGELETETDSSLSLSGSIRELIKRLAKDLYKRTFTAF
ncbi:MAG: hypothetical protein H8E38_09000 [SAR324 cluster bacterium]|nr:hypothetical protein [SAR324 cluster bacterium]MBL7034296.1 hypothetical protein [SAR324 cluster bacterium]